MEDVREEQLLNHIREMDEVDPMREQSLGTSEDVHMDVSQSLEQSSSSRNPPGEFFSTGSVDEEDDVDGSFLQSEDGSPSSLWKEPSTGEPFSPVPVQRDWTMRSSKGDANVDMSWSMVLGSANSRRRAPLHSGELGDLQRTNALTFEDGGATMPGARTTRIIPPGESPEGSGGPSESQPKFRVEFERRGGFRLGDVRDAGLVPDGDREMGEGTPGRREERRGDEDGEGRVSFRNLRRYGRLYFFPGKAAGEDWSIFQFSGRKYHGDGVYGESRSFSDS